MKQVIRVIGIALFFAVTSSAFAAEQDPKDIVILRLRKALLETQMDNFQLRYDKIRKEWKEVLKQLGEQDPDAEQKPEAKK